MLRRCECCLLKTTDCWTGLNAGDKLLSRDENMHFLETDAGQRGVFEHVTSILRGTRTHPRIETFVMAIFGDDSWSASVSYIRIVQAGWWWARNTDWSKGWIVAITTAREGGDGPPYAFSLADRCTTMHTGNVQTKMWSATRSAGSYQRTPTKKSTRCAVFEGQRLSDEQSARRTST